MYLRHSQALLNSFERDARRKASADQGSPGPQHLPHGSLPSSAALLLPVHKVRNDLAHSSVGKAKVSFRQSLRESQRPCTLPGSPLSSVHFNTRICCRSWGSHAFSCSENQHPSGSCVSAWIFASARYQSRVPCDPVWLSQKETLSSWIREMTPVCEGERLGNARVLRPQ